MDGKKRIISVPGFTVGMAEDRAGLTGVTVLLAPPGGAAAGVDVRGCAPGTRETDLLSPEKTVDRIHAVVLSGGSAFGLEASCGVMRYLSEKGVGFHVGKACVPIVCGAVLFDLEIGSASAFPDRDMGYLAASRESPELEAGCRGAGMGATVGKLLGFGRAMKSGAGYCELRLASGLVVGAYVAVNACGEVYEGDRTLAGILSEDGASIVSSHEAMLSGIQRQMSGANTTIGCIITNAKLTKAQCRTVCAMGHDGLARSIRPVHTSMDGDTLFAMSSGTVVTSVDTAGYLAAEAVRRAVIDAVESAESLGGRPSMRELTE